MMLFQVMTQRSRFFDFCVIVIFNMYSSQLPLHVKKDGVALRDVCVGSKVPYLTLFHIIQLTINHRHRHSSSKSWGLQSHPLNLGGPL